MDAAAMLPKSKKTARTPPDIFSSALANPVSISHAPIVVADNSTDTPVSRRRLAIKRLKLDNPNDTELVEQLHDEIINLKKMMVSCAENIQLLLIENKDLKNELSDIKKLVVNGIHKSNPICLSNSVTKTPVVASFASVLKIGKPVLINPKTPSATPAATQKVLKEKLNPSDYELNRVKTTKDGGVVVECISSADRNKLISNAKAQFGDKFDVTIPIKVCRIRICGLSDNPTDPTRLITTLHNQNAEIVLSDASIKVVHSFPLKNKLRFGVILEVDCDTARRLLDAKRVFVDWEKCVDYEDLNIRRCYKCWGFNHTAAKCSATHFSCSKCSEKHQTAECTSTVEKCIACIGMASARHLLLDVNHMATSSECPTYRHRADLARSATNYAS